MLVKRIWMNLKETDNSQFLKQLDIFEVYAEKGI